MSTPTMTAEELSAVRAMLSSGHIAAPLVVSEYLDDGRFGILDGENRIVIGVGRGLTREQCVEICVKANGKDVAE